MAEFLDVFKLLEAGGNLAVIALLWVMWKFDRRLLLLEVALKALLEKIAVGK